MLDKVHFENFKILKNVTCDLGQFNVIVGPNASGKTSMLQAVNLLSTKIPPNKGFSLYNLTGLDKLHSGDGSDAMTLACFAQGDEVNFKASTSQATVDGNKQEGSGWFASLIGRKKGSTAVSYRPLDDGNEAAKSIKSVRFLHLEFSRLAMPSYSEDEDPQVEHSGKSLATVIANMKLGSEEKFESLKTMIRRIVPQLENIRIEKRKTKTFRKEIVSIRDQHITTRAPQIQMRDALLFDFTNRKGVAAYNVSEGTLIALGLLTVLHGPARPGVILLDDIEKGLHPKAQKNLVEMLREILSRQPDLQIIATSHSPYFLDFLTFEEVRLMTVGDDGYSVCGRLEDHPKFEKWKDELAPGEMWSLFGEKWMTEKEST